MPEHASLSHMTKHTHSHTSCGFHIHHSLHSWISSAYKKRTQQKQQVERNNKKKEHNEDERKSEKKQQRRIEKACVWWKNIFPRLFGVNSSTI